MNKQLLILLFFIFSCSSAFAQKAKCLTEILHQEAMLKDSVYRNNRLRIQREMTSYAKTNLFSYKYSQTRIIPVVFHVIHTDGDENISLAQIQDQINILNTDYRRRNKDTVNTPGPFRNVAIDTDIEFRLAQKDPNGQCTQGVVRIYSPLTNNARDNVKDLSSWPSDRYLNIWTVKSIINTSGPGTVLGYAQFPGGKIANYDGVVLRSDVIGSIGSAASSFGASEGGRTATHEVGHWLNLYHTWGDKSGCQGTDEVSDTPPQETASSGCPNFPFTDACSPTGSGIMFMNYMDYTDGNCLNLFTAGQKVRMDYTLANLRSSVVDSQNLASTGTEGSAPQQCPPVADFRMSNTMVCPGTSILLQDQSYNGTPTSFLWSFPGGNPAVSSLPNPNVIYALPGKYDITLKVSNQAGTNYYTRKEAITVNDPMATYTAPFKEDFETDDFPGTDWKIINEDNGNTWERTTSSTHTRDGRLSIQNFQANIPLLKDILISPSLDLSGLTSPHLSFKIAYAKTKATNSDKMSVYISKTCGQNWSLIAPFPKAGDTLATADIMTDDFIPNPLQWRLENLDLAPKLFTGSKSNVRFKFEFQNGGGNNVYLDDIHVDNGPSPSNVESLPDLSFYPNPATHDVYMAFNLYEAAVCSLTVLDPMGKEFLVFVKQSFLPGEHRYHIDAVTDPGFYFVKMVVGKTTYINKLVLQ
jgi:PKD repeat protein